ncbi:general secretion pathway protein GspI, partial [Azospirillum brasilense]
MTGRRHRGQQGLTLLELLVAFAIMALALGMLYRAMGGSARSVADVDRYQRAVVLAQSLLALRDAVPEQGW